MIRLPPCQKGKWEPWPIRNDEERARERWNKINRRGGGVKRSEGTLTETQQVWRKEWMKDDKKREAQCEKE